MQGVWRVGGACGLRMLAACLARIRTDPGRHVGYHAAGESHSGPILRGARAILAFRREGAAHMEGRLATVIGRGLCPATCAIRPVRP